MPSMIKLILVALVTLSVNARAEETQIPYSSIECGDHWFKIYVSLDQASNKAEISLGGDVNPDVTERVGIYSFNGHDLRIEFTDYDGGFLSLDGTDHYHGIYWGSGKQRWSEKNLESYGLCNVQ